jgi:hypothetical protein
VAVKHGLEAALHGAIPDPVPTARRITADAKSTAPVTGTALLVLGNHGSKADMALLAARRDDTRAFYGYTTIDGKKYEVQVRDVAAEMSLLLRGEDYEKYGFERSNVIAWWVGPDPAPHKSVQWFNTGEERDAALEKAWAWLDRQPKASVEPPAGKK